MPISYSSVRSRFERDLLMPPFPVKMWWATNFALGFCCILPPGPIKEYIGRRKGTPGRKVSILGPLDPPGTLGPGRREIQTCHNENFFLLQVRANLRPLLLFGPPYGGVEKWSRICSNSKHSRDITIVSLVTQWIIPGNLNFPPARTQSTQRAQRTQYRHFSSGSALPS